METLLDEGAHISSSVAQIRASREGMGTALHRAVEGGYEAVGEIILLKSRADARLNDPMGRLPPPALARGKGQSDDYGDA